MSKPIPLAERGKPETSCSHCGLFDLCFAHEIAESRRDELDAIVRRQRSLEHESHLFHAGQQLKAVCVVQSGTVKTYQLSTEGEEVVTGFHLPGELIGLDAIGGGKHPEFAVALEDSRYCEIPFRDFQRILDQSPSLNQLMLRLLSVDMAETRSLLLVIGRMDARARVAAFLLNMSRRLKRRGEDGTRFRLSMDRRDIANYLGLTIETVSRTLSWMQKQGMVTVRGKLVQLSSIDELLETAGREHEQLLLRRKTA
ncbi:MAG: fumarate/nitrate reduction transcriptional regulator Fnr [Wenzhouxiangellaceae bacterium]|nr:fumarate/nitrate reduction transcriptional regulator Fnr [Wenzhouxiangellaceae bacterium]